MYSLTSDYSQQVLVLYLDRPLLRVDRAQAELGSCGGDVVGAHGCSFVRSVSGKSVDEDLGSLDQSLPAGRSFRLAIPLEIRTFDHETKILRYGLLLGSDLTLDSQASS